MSSLYCLPEIGWTRTSLRQKYVPMVAKVLGRMQDRNFILVRPAHCDDDGSAAVVADALVLHWDVLRNKVLTKAGAVRSALLREWRAATGMQAKSNQNEHSITSAEHGRDLRSNMCSEKYADEDRRRLIRPQSHHQSPTLE